MPYYENLKMIKKEKQLTNAEISRLGDVPLSTVTRVFSEKTPNATFETMDRISIALGVSLDEIAGRKPTKEQPLTNPIIDAFGSYSELLKEKDSRIAGLEKDKEVIRNEKYKLVAVIIALVLILFALMGVLVWFNIDVRNGNFGRFRY